MLDEITQVFVELTEPDSIVIDINNNEMVITIVSKWFYLQTYLERLEYLDEGMQINFPELIHKFIIVYVALTPLEADENHLKIAS